MKPESTLSLHVYASASRKELANVLLEITRQLLMTTNESDVISTDDGTIQGSWSIETDP